MTRWTADQIDHVWHPFVQMQEYREKALVIVEGSGIRVKDVNGKEYIDAISSLWNVCTGHGNEEMIEAITTQLKSLEFFSLFGYSNEPSLLLAEKLCEWTNGQFKHFYFTNSGSEAVDTALKIVRQYFVNQGSTKRKVIYLNRAYHGTTIGALCVSGTPEDTEKFQPLLDGFIPINPAYCYRCSQCYPECGLDCADELERVILREGADNVAALIAEPVLASGGVIVPPDGYFTKIKNICEKYGVLFIADEITTAFGRLGHRLGLEAFGVMPDIILLAKGITSGYLPLGAVGISDQVYSAFYGTLQDNKHFNHGFTTSGHPVCCQAALTNLKILQREQLIETVPSKGKHLGALLKKLQESPIVGDVRGCGLLWGIELVKNRETRELFDPQKMVAQVFYEIARRKGLLTFPTAGNVIVLAPPIISTFDDLERIAEIVEQSLVLVEKYIHL